MLNQKIKKVNCECTFSAANHKKSNAVLGQIFIGISEKPNQIDETNDSTKICGYYVIL